MLCPDGGGSFKGVPWLFLLRTGMFGLPGGLTTAWPLQACLAPKVCAEKKLAGPKARAWHVAAPAGCAAEDIVQKMGFCRIEAWIFIIPPVARQSKTTGSHRAALNLRISQRGSSCRPSMRGACIDCCQAHPISPLQDSMSVCFQRISSTFHSRHSPSHVFFIRTLLLRCW